MRNRFILLFVALVAVVALSAGLVYAEPVTDDSTSEDVTNLFGDDEGDSCCACDGWWDCCCPPLWSVSAGAAFLHRSKPHGSTLIDQYDLNTRTWSPAVDADVFSFNWSTGVDVSAVRRVDRCPSIDAVDFRYIGVQDWQANHSLIMLNRWRFPLMHTSFSSAAVDFSYSSKLNSAEINVRRNSSFSRLTWLAGFRWLGLDEQLVPRVQLLPSGPPAYYTYATRNNLFGGQIGAIATLWDKGGPLSIESTLKAGLYGNTASNCYEIVDSLGQYMLLSSDRKDRIAFVGDIGIQAAYHWNDHIALQAGYQLLWIQGVALASDQPIVADYYTHSGILTNGGVFYHGALASVNLTW